MNSVLLLGILVTATCVLLWIDYECDTLRASIATRGMYLGLTLGVVALAGLATWYSR